MGFNSKPRSEQVIFLGWFADKLLPTVSTMKYSTSIAAWIGNTYLRGIYIAVAKFNNYNNNL